MKFSLKHTLLATAAVGLFSLAGCELDYEPDAYPASAYVAPYPAGYDVYYYGGWYDGSYWYWRDRYGHLYHEARAMHEQRAAREHFDRRAFHGGPEGRVGRPGGGPAGHEGHIGGGHDGGEHR